MQSIFDGKYIKLNSSEKNFIHLTTFNMTLLTRSRFLLAHDKSFHIRNKATETKTEEKSTENIPTLITPKLEIEIQKKSLPLSQKKTNITQKEKVLNQVTTAETNKINFPPQPGELVFLMLLAVPALLFSLKRWKYK